MPSRGGVAVFGSALSVVDLGNFAADINHLEVSSVSRVLLVRKCVSGGVRNAKFGMEELSKLTKPLYTHTIPSLTHQNPLETQPRNG